MTLRAYLDMLRLEDRLFEHEAYGAAAEAAVECYVRLHDEDRHGAAARAAEAAVAGLSEEARKRAVEKRAKEAAKAAKAAAAETEKARLHHNSKRHAGKFDDVRRRRRAALGRCALLSEGHGVPLRATHPACFTES